MLGDDVY